MAHLNNLQFRTFYHGTNPMNAESITKHGLKAHNPVEGLRGQIPDEDLEDYGHPTGVYLADDIETARGYGDAVFAVDLPNRADWRWTEGEGHVLGHDIHPYMLKRVE